MSRQEDFIEAGIAYRMKHGKPMCIAGSNLADVERDFNRVMSFEEGAEHGYQYCKDKSVTVIEQILASLNGGNGVEKEIHDYWVNTYLKAMEE